ncbi:MAG: SCO family protein [Anaerolineaceae bacterium]|nr:SCO family protein [Anaerolineaceae bacterium]
MKHVKLYLLLLLALLLVACGGTGETAVQPNTSGTITSDEMMDDTMVDDEMADSSVDESMEDEEMMDESMDDDTAMTEHEEGMAELDETMEEMDDMAEEMDDDMSMTDAPAWMTVSLTDVRSGETFTLADFAGKTVFVEPMATWCTNCRRQLGNVAQAKAQLGGSEDVVFVSVSVETNIGNGDLANYTEETGFDWIFAVATPEMLISLADTFGQTVTNPPSTPHFIIRPDGTTTDLTTGYEGPEEILQNLEAESQS